MVNNLGTIAKSGTKVDYLCCFVGVFFLTYCRRALWKHSAQALTYP